MGYCEVTFSLQSVFGHGPSWQLAPQACPQVSLVFLHGCVHFFMLALASYEPLELTVDFKHCPEWHGSTQECFPQDKGKPQDLPQENASR